MPHHEDCWRENGGCTTFGCNGQPAARPAPAGDRSPAYDSDHIELSLEDLSRCAACGEEISVWDETCRQCGTPTSLPPSLARGRQGQARYPGMPAQPYPYGAFGYYNPPYPRQKKNPAAACLLNMLFPGIGYFYLNNVKKGITIMLVTIVLGVISYSAYGLLMLAMLFYAMIDCYQTAERMNRGLV